MKYAGTLLSPVGVWPYSGFWVNCIWTFDSIRLLRQPLHWTILKRVRFFPGKEIKKVYWIGKLLSKVDVFVPIFWWRLTSPWYFSPSSLSDHKISYGLNHSYFMLRWEFQSGRISKNHFESGQTRIRNENLPNLKQFLKDSFLLLGTLFSKWTWIIVHLIVPQTRVAATLKNSCLGGGGGGYTECSVFTHKTSHQNGLNPI
jgi:hypothetical protein